MDEVSAQRDPENDDADERLARDPASWFARELSDEWQSVEPGIYRHVGKGAGDDGPASEPTKRKAKR